MRPAFYYLLLISFLFISEPIFFLYAQTLEINSAVEQRFYQGSPEQIKDFIKKYETNIKNIISKLNLIPRENLSDKDKKNLLDALELFEGLSFQFLRLKRELRIPEYTIPLLPQLGSVPYKLQELDKYISLYRKLTQKLKEYQKKLRIISADISDIEEQLKQTFLMYVNMKNVAEKKIESYSMLAQLISLQVEYSLKMLRKKKLDRAINKLVPAIGECRDNIERIFNNLVVSKDDIILIINKKKEISKKEESFKNKILSKQRVLNKKITFFELRLDNIIDKLGSSRISDAGKKLLNIEKERIEAYLNRLQYQKEILNQKNLYPLKLNKIYLDFRYDWITNYSGYPGYKKTEFIIREWNKRLEQIKQEISQLKEKQEQKRFELSLLNERIIRIKKEIDTETDQQVKDSLKTLYDELMLNKNYLNELVALLSSNLAYLKEIAWNIENILFLIQNRISHFERISYEIKERIQNIWLHIRGVIYYPLWSIGGNVITIITILKIIFFLGLGIYILRLIRKKISKFLIERMGLSSGLVNSISTLTYYFLLLLVVFVALSTAGVNLSQITIILGALGVGIGFGLQTIANNFISGLILLTERTIKVGDIVELENGLTGIVKDISIRSTVIRTYDGLDIVVPNSDFIANKVTTWTYGDDWRRLRIPFGVSYGTDPDRVAEIAKEVARQITTTIEDKDHPITVWFEGFGESSLDFSLLVWCRMKKLKPVTGLISDYYFALFRRFKEEGIEIPFPQRDIHIRSVPSYLIKNKKEGEEDGGV